MDGAQINTEDLITTQLSATSATLKELYINTAFIQTLNAINIATISFTTTDLDAIIQDF